MSSVRKRFERRNPAGELARVWDEFCSDLRYEYDARGNLTRLHNADDTAVVMIYNDRDMKVEINDPSQGHWQFAYNALGEMTRKLDARGQALDYEYDEMGRLIVRHELRDINSLNEEFPNRERTLTAQWDNSYGSRSGQPGTLISLSLEDAQSGAIVHSRQYFYDGWGRLNCDRRRHW